MHLSQQDIELASASSTLWMTSPNGGSPERLQNIALYCQSLYCNYTNRVSTAPTVREQSVNGNLLRNEACIFKSKEVKVVYRDRNFVQV